MTHMSRSVQAAHAPRSISAAAAAAVLSIAVAASAIGAVGISALGERSASGTRAADTRPQGSRVQEPLVFEPNVGQTDPQVRFLTRAGGAEVFFTPTEAVSVWSGAAQMSDRSQGRRASLVAATSVLRMQLVGGNPVATVTGADALAGHVNYLIGNDPARWHTNVSTYGRVTIHDAYPGVDMTWHSSTDHGLEYDFIVAPGANPSNIALHFAGAQAVHADPTTGDLIVSIDGRQVREHAPGAYQVAADGALLPVDAHFVISSTATVAFALGGFDATRPLIIDPRLAYSTYLGGTGDDQADAVAADATGNAYIAGGTASLDFPTTAGASQSTNKSGFTSFVTKINPTGSALVYSTYVGGSCQEGAVGIAVDAMGHAYIAGATCSSDYPTTAGALQTARVTNWPLVVTELDATGASLLYSTFINADFSPVSGLPSDQFPPLGDLALGPAMQAGGAPTVYVVGTGGAGAPVTAGAFQTAAPSQGLVGAYLARINPVGTGSADLEYGTYVAGLTQNSDVNAVVVDHSGIAYMTGGTFDRAFPTTAGAYQERLAGSDEDAFVTKLNPAGGGVSDLLYSTFLGGSGPKTGPEGFDNPDDEGRAIAIDSKGTIFVTGITDSSQFPTTPGAIDRQFSCVSNLGCMAFVSRLTPAGRGSKDLAYSTYLGGGGADTPHGIVVDSHDHAFVAGGTFSPLFPTKNALQKTCGCFFFSEVDDAFVSELSASGTSLVFSTFLGGTDEDYAYGLASGPSGSVFVVGQTASPGSPPPGVTPIPFPTTPGVVQPAFAGGSQFYRGDGFVTKIGGV